MNKFFIKILIIIFLINHNLPQSSDDFQYKMNIFNHIKNDIYKIINIQFPFSSNEIIEPGLCSMTIITYNLQFIIEKYNKKYNKDFFAHDIYKDEIYGNPKLAHKFLGNIIINLINNEIFQYFTVEEKNVIDRFLLTCNYIIQENLRVLQNLLNIPQDIYFIDLVKKQWSDKLPINNNIAKYILMNSLALNEIFKFYKLMIKNSLLMILTFLNNKDESIKNDFAFIDSMYTSNNKKDNTYGYMDDFLLDFTLITEENLDKIIEILKKPTIRKYILIDVDGLIKFFTALKKHCNIIKNSIESMDYLIKLLKDNKPMASNS